MSGFLTAMGLGVTAAEAALAAGSVPCGAVAEDAAGAAVAALATDSAGVGVGMVTPGIAAGWLMGAVAGAASSLLRSLMFLDNSAMRLELSLASLSLAILSSGIRAGLP